VLQRVTFRELWRTSRALETGFDRPRHRQPHGGGTSPSSRRDLAKTREVQRDPIAVAELDAAFHKLIGMATHNRVLQLAKEPTSILVRPTTAHIITNNPSGIPRLIEAHTHIVDALRRRDRDKGRLWVDRHLRDWKAGFESTGHDLNSAVDAIIKLGSGAAEQPAGR
jgi:hypothetical protein